jgi:hypothetical protein
LLLVLLRGLRPALVLLAYLSQMMSLGLVCQPGERVCWQAMQLLAEDLKEVVRPEAPQQASGDSGSVVVAEEAC